MAIDPNDASVAACTRRVAHDLMGAFIWRDTPQGHNYWANIHSELIDLADAYANNQRELEGEQQ